MDKYKRGGEVAIHFDPKHIVKQKESTRREGLETKMGIRYKNDLDSGQIRIEYEYNQSIDDFDRRLHCNIRTYNKNR